MSDIKQVVNQLRALAAEPENREYILQDKTCFRGIVKFLDSSDLDVVHSALEIVQFLCCMEKNCNVLDHVMNNSRQQMAKEAELVSCLKRLMVDFSLPTTSKKLAGNIYATLQRHLPDRVPMYAAASETHSSSVLRETTNTSSNNHFGSGSATGLSIFSEKITTSLSVAKSYTVITIVRVTHFSFTLSL